MKKWFLLSTIVNISILFLPGYKTVEKNLDKKIIHIKSLTLATNKKIEINKINSLEKNRKFEKRQVASVDNYSKNINEEIKKSNESEIFITKKTETNPKQESLDQSIAINDEKNEHIESGNAEIKTLETDAKEAVVEAGEDRGEKTSIFENKKEVTDTNYIGENFVKDNSNLLYKLIEAPIPKYPLKAQFFGFDKIIEIKAIFTVDKYGFVKDIILDSKDEDYKKYNFDKSVYKALSKYKFTPILYEGKNVEVRFIKNFEFKK